MSGDAAAILLGGAARLVRLLQAAGTRRRQMRHRENLRKMFSEEE